jgi:arginase
MNRRVSLIGAPTDIGAAQRGASMGPEALRVADIGPVLVRHGLDVVDRGNLGGPANPWQPPQGGYRHLDAVAAWCRSVHDAVHAELAAGRMPILLGGDHSLAIGSISAVARHCREQGRKLRVLWLDAHADFNTSELSPSGNVHGMPLAAALGLGGAAFESDVYPLPAVRRVALLGVRSLDPGERELLSELDACVFTMSDLDRIGIEPAIRQALEHVSGDGFVHVSLDMDVLDPEVAPGVGTPVRGGLSYREAHLALELVAEAQVLRSLEVVEVNPILDRENETAELAVELVASALGARIL